MGSSQASNKVPAIDATGCWTPATPSCCIVLLLCLLLPGCSNMGKEQRPTPFLLQVPAGCCVVSCARLALSQRAVLAHA
jgi:hypothetical protein